ncbi:MAG: SMC-Scp complex subunit ScpB [Candidatus Uhrbacteria bacterium]|nr:SMC-Scp complex subunit ScpB [Candidatus Uhrbacteria bacterium]
MTLDALIEALLFATSQPMSTRKIAEAVSKTPKEVEDALNALHERLESSGSGTRLVRSGQTAELVTHPDAAGIVRAALKQELHGELSKPSLESLAILAYRGPMTRPELEQIRGVQSSLILRNLMLRGLVEQKEDARLGQPVYGVTVAFFKHIGLSGAETLPDYGELRGHSAVEQALQELVASEEKTA